MKKLILVMAISVMVVMPVLANSSLINLGYNVQLYTDYDYSRQGIGAVFTCLAGQTSGFYSQFAPFIALSSRSGGSVFNYLQNQVWGAGLNFTLGYGGDIPLGAGLGVILGGGFFGTVYGSYDSYWDYLYYEAAAGAGGGAHLYFQPGKGSLLLNIGIDAAWRPLEVWGDTDWGFEGFAFEKGEFNININAGIGFRR
jgi:hypothetical protein